MYAIQTPVLFDVHAAVAFSGDIKTVCCRSAHVSGRRYAFCVCTLINHEILVNILDLVHCVQWPVYSFFLILLKSVATQRRGEGCVSICWRRSG